MGLKKIILIVTLFSISLSCFSQNKQEIRGKYKSFVLEDMPGYYYVYSKENIFNQSIPSYLNNTPIPNVEIKNQVLLNLFIRKYLMSFFINYTGEFNNNINPKIQLYSDRNGKITDISIMYPKEIGIIPIEILEGFYQSILNTCIDLQFNIKDERFNDAQWIVKLIEYESKDLQKGVL